MNFNRNLIAIIFLGLFHLAILADEHLIRSSIVWHMPRDTNYVSLTFDDGPNTDVTPKLLDVLMQKNVSATFFLVGHMIVRYPQVVKNIANDGHDIANHTWAHYRLDEMSSFQIGQQILATSMALDELGVNMIPYLRPPGGRYNDLVVDVANEQGLQVLMWDVNANDSKLGFKDPNEIVERVISRIKPGSIILLHNSYQTVQILSELIDRIHAKGFVIGPLSFNKITAKGLSMI